jgi:hypothetical protein
VLLQLRFANSTRRFFARLSSVSFEATGARSDQGGISKIHDLSNSLFEIRMGVGIYRPFERGKLSTFGFLFDRLGFRSNIYCSFAWH